MELTYELDHVHVFLLLVLGFLLLAQVVDRAGDALDGRRERRHLRRLARAQREALDGLEKEANELAEQLVESEEELAGVARERDVLRERLRETEPGAAPEAVRAVKDAPASPEFEALAADQRARREGAPGVEALADEHARRVREMRERSTPPEATPVADAAAPLGELVRDELRRAGQLTHRIGEPVGDPAPKVPRLCGLPPHVRELTLKAPRPEPQVQPGPSRAARPDADEVLPPSPGSGCPGCE